MSIFNKTNVDRQLRGDPLEVLTAMFDAPCLLPAQRRTLWTMPTMVRPALSAKRHGAGDLLLGLQPMMHRPCYYLVWIDAQWFPQHGDTTDEFMDALDNKIWPSLEEEFGYRDSESNAKYRWPEVDDEGGCCWFVASASDILTERQQRRMCPSFQRREIPTKGQP